MSMTLENLTVAKKIQWLLNKKISLTTEQKISMTTEQQNGGKKNSSYL